METNGDNINLAEGYKLTRSNSASKLPSQSTL